MKGIKMKQLLLYRYKYTETTTIGKLYIDGVMFGYTLEDAVRPEGVKIYGKTAIPEGTYPVTLSYSPRFKRMLPMINQVPDFQGVRFHGGNDHEDTEGCPLVAAHLADEDEVDMKIWGSLEEELVEELDGQEVMLTIRNLRNV
jgi:hypothetical protein